MTASHEKTYISSTKVIQWKTKEKIIVEQAEASLVFNTRGSILLSTAKYPFFSAEKPEHTWTGRPFPMTLVVPVVSGKARFAVIMARFRYLRIHPVSLH